MTFDQKIQLKAESLHQLLAKDYPYLLNKQASIMKGSPESGAWYSGYYVALCDVMRLMNAELENTANEGNQESDKGSPFL